MCYFYFGIIWWSMICYCHDECIRFRYIWRNCIKRSRMHLPGIDSPSLHPVMHHCLLACCTVMHLLAPLPPSPPAVPCTMALLHLSVLPAALYRVLGSPPPSCSSLPNNPPSPPPPSLPAVPIQWAIHFICRPGPVL